MNSIEFAVSPKTLNYLFGFLLYFPSLLIINRRLFPYLTGGAKSLARVALVAQVTLIVVALEVEPRSVTEEWLWDIDKEWNIPSGIASIVVALIGGVALLTAWLARSWPKWNRRWLIAVGILFLALGLEEFLDTKYADPNWPLYYTAVGIAVALATLAVAARSPRQQHVWFLCLFYGLALMAFGVIFIDETPLNCSNSHSSGSTDA